MPKLNWLFSLFAIAGFSTIALPVSGQALLPYTLQLDSEELEQQGVALIQDAVQLVRFEQYDLALPRAKLATQLAPNLFETWFVLGSLYVQQKEFDKGIEVLMKARAIAPDEPGIMFTLGSAYFQKTNYNAAIKELEAGLKLDPEATEALFDLGNSYLMLQRYPESIAVYERAIAQNEEFWPAINNIGLVKYEQGDVAGAIQHWRDSVAVDPEAAEPQLAIAVALYTQGQQQEGIKLGEAALSLDRKYADVEFLKENLWGERLIGDTQRFLAIPEIQAVIERFQS